MNIAIHVEKDGRGGFYGWIEGVNGIVADGPTKEAVLAKLKTLYQAKVQFDSQGQTDEGFKYLVAQKFQRILVVKYSPQWSGRMFDYLHDKGYRMKKSTARIWASSKDEKGRPAERYYLDEAVRFFDVGEY